MKVGILGTGQVGEALAAGFTKHGHEVKLGHRDPKASYADAAKFGKVVIDVTNPLKVEESKAPELALGFTDSGGEQVQRWLPKSRVVKAFNIRHDLQGLWIPRD